MATPSEKLSMRENPMPDISASETTAVPVFYANGVSVSLNATDIQVRFLFNMDITAIVAMNASLAMSLGEQLQGIVGRFSEETGVPILKLEDMIQKMREVKAKQDKKK